MSLKNVNVVNSQRTKKIAIIIANPTVSSTTKWPVGFWWSELTHPFYAFTEKGYAVEIFSPRGGPCEADSMSDPRDPSGYSASDLISLGFINSPKLMEMVKSTKPVAEIQVKNFDAVVVAGGQAPMFSYEKETELHKKFVEFYESGKVAAALCHGVSLLKFARLSNGELLVKGKTVTGFANVEEDFADEAVWSMNLLPKGTHLMPWRIEDDLRALGANFLQAGLWKGFAVRDGNLVTGQQNFSGGETAEVIIRALGE